MGAMRVASGIPAVLESAGEAANSGKTVSFSVPPKPLILAAKNADDFHPKASLSGVRRSSSVVSNLCDTKGCNRPIAAFANKCKIQ